MVQKRDTKPKGTSLTQLDEIVTSYDGEPIWRSKESIAGTVILERDEDGQPVENQILEQVKLTRRMAINLALALEPKEEVANADAKLRAGHLQHMFWKDPKVELDSEDVEFLKSRLNFRWNGTVYCYMCEYLEGTEAKE